MSCLVYSHAVEQPHGSRLLHPGEQGFDVVIGDGPLLPPGLSPGVLDDLLDVGAGQAAGLACQGMKNAFDRGPVGCGNVGLGHGVPFQVMPLIPFPARSRKTASGSV